MALKLLRNPRLLIALILIMTGLVVVIAVLVWPQKPGLTLRLKILRTGIENGQPGVLFHIEGAEQYPLYVQSFSYLLGKNAASRDATFSIFSPAREFWVTAPSEYYADLRDQGWKVQADVLLFAPEKNDIGKFFRVMRDAWRYSHMRGPRPSNPPSFFSTAKFLWQANRQISYKRTPISQMITNTPPG